MTGYAHRLYARSLAEFGTPRELPRSAGWILEREIPGSPHRDAMGCYPLFACRNWSQLHADLDELAHDLVSLSLVADPFGEHGEEHLRRCFRDEVFPFKQHYVADLSKSIDSIVSPHHRRYARKALSEIHVERCEEPTRFLREWTELYTVLIERHHIKGIAAFSQTAFSRQLSVPGLVMFRAVHGEATIGILLWYTQGEVCYYHLGAFNDLGYQKRASFALFWTAIEYFKAREFRWLSLGAGAGVRDDSEDGLSRFKGGWSTETRTAYFCGRIFDEARYQEIVRAKGTSGTDYFPAYRAGEFG
jgi:hypothetical protein